MNKRHFLVTRSIVLTAILLCLGWYLHSSDVKTHNAVNMDPAQATATIAGTKGSPLSGTYLIVNFTDNQGRQDQTHVWYGWTLQKFATGTPVVINYSGANPLKAYVLGRTTQDNFKIYEIAAPSIIAFSIVASYAFLKVGRRKRPAVARAY